MSSKSPKESVEEKPTLLTLEFVVSLLLCGGHAYSLYLGYASILSTSNLTVSSALHSPLLNWSELSLGSQIPAIPVTGPLFYLAGVYLLSWFVKGTGLTFSMKGTMMAYNLYSTLLSGVMFTLFATRFVTRCMEERALVYVFHAGDKDFALWVGALYLNMHSKFLEYLDTFIMCLRGKFQQVTDLHVIHHAEMGPIMYIVSVLGEGGGAIATGPMINSFVHFVMYGASLAHFGALCLVRRTHHSSPPLSPPHPPSTLNQATTLTRALETQG
jgi:hypothetical protein